MSASVTSRGFLQEATTEQEIPIAESFNVGYQRLVGCSVDDSYSSDVANNYQQQSLWPQSLWSHPLAKTSVLSAGSLVATLTVGYLLSEDTGKQTISPYRYSLPSQVSAETEDASLLPVTPLPPETIEFPDLQLIPEFAGEPQPDPVLSQQSAELEKLIALLTAENSNAQVDPRSNAFQFNSESGVNRQLLNQPSPLTIPVSPPEILQLNSSISSIEPAQVIEQKSISSPSGRSTANHLETTLAKPADAERSPSQPETELTSDQAAVSAANQPTPLPLNQLADPIEPAALSLAEAIPLETIQPFLQWSNQGKVGLLPFADQSKPLSKSDLAKSDLAKSSPIFYTFLKEYQGLWSSEVIQAR
ncbi:MAG: hypothetical protein F6K19_36275 [Cyanothece sp. SIO1E1]|nr:hypothetical protein [Cyanothece sp. SIO1E1]